MCNRMLTSETMKLFPNFRGINIWLQINIMCNKLRLNSWGFFTGLSYRELYALKSL